MEEMRFDEELAKQEFHNYLSSKTIDGISWKSGNQNVPPDFYLSVGTNKFVVEVTALSEQIRTPRGIKPKRTILGSCNQLAEDIEKDALKSGQLKGTYYIGFGPIEIDFYDVRKQLKQQILELIGQTQTVSEVDITPILIDDQEYCSVFKSGDPEAHVGISLYPPSAKWQGNAEVEACELLESAVSGKAKRLASFTQSKILILLLDYGFVKPEQYCRCLDSLSQLNAFHTIFIVGSVNYMLHTLNSEWM